MFNKSGYKLKSDFRKLLLSTDGIYQESISSEEKQSIIFMWSKFLDDNSNILVSRFQKQRNQFGFRMSTNLTDRGYQHQVRDVVKNSDISQNTQIAVDDIILEVNGINLTQLSYTEVSILFSALPNNIQFVYSKKESEYEKLDVSVDERNQSLNRFNNDWTYPITIIVQGSRKESDGLEFINNLSTSKSYSKSVIKKIKPTGYCYKDRRISINDSIVKINNQNVQNLSDEEIYKLLLSKKYSNLYISLAKYKGNKLGSHSDVATFSRCQSTTLETVTNRSATLERRLSKSQIITPSRLQDYPSYTDLSENENLVSLDINGTDDLGIYLVDVKNKKSVICGFTETSKLKKKFRIGDEIVKINDENVVNFSSLEIGKLMKKYHNQFDCISVTISRGTKPYKFNSSLIVPHESSIQDSDSISDKSKTKFVETSNEDDENHINFNVSIHKVNNSFGLYIQSCNGPTINKVLPESDIYQDIIRSGDKIIRINDIYVKNKEHDFVLTLIRSCGQTMNLELSRNIESRKYIECTENPIYYPESDPESSIYLPSNKTDHSEISNAQIEQPHSSMPKIRPFLTNVK